MLGCFSVASSWVFRTATKKLFSKTFPVNEQATARALYKKLLALYPPGFRERVGESMEQTFRDLCDEQKGRPTRGFLVLAIFAETAIGITQEQRNVSFAGRVRAKPSADVEKRRT